jgi:hypothetical protein
VLSAALAALVTLASVAPASRPAALPDLRVIRRLSPRHRFVRLRAEIDGDGVRGEETGLYDLATGRFVERIVAGPVSFSDGFDGARVWSADATGMPIVAGNAEDRLDALAWAHFFGRGGPERPAFTRLAVRPGEVVVRLRYTGLSAPIDVTLNQVSGLVTAIEDDSRGEAGRSHFADYRRVDDVLLPFRADTATRYGPWHERVRAVDFPAGTTDDAFGPPPRPQDAELDGITAVPLEMRRGHPVVAIRIDHGPVLRVLFDTGSSNILTPEAARRAGLQTVGEGKIGGMGPSVVRQRYATARRLTIGRAVLHDQPFSVVDDQTSGLDGAIGCEVLQRFATRFDFRRKTVELARDARLFGIRATPIAFRFSGCQPEIDGALDGLPGAISIDTGDANAFDVTAPFVRAHKLIARYRTTQIGFADAIGGASMGFFAHAKTLRLGPVVAHDVPIILNAATSGAMNDPAELGNVGIPVLARFVAVFDYRNSRMWLLR